MFWQKKNYFLTGAAFFIEVVLKRTNLVLVYLYFLATTFKGQKKQPLKVQLIDLIVF
jgi:hypothetical protein